MSASVSKGGKDFSETVRTGAYSRDTRREIRGLDTGESPEVIQRDHTRTRNREKKYLIIEEPPTLFHRGRETRSERFTTAGGGKVTRHVESPLG